MADKKSGGKRFAFLWKLENISYCLQKKGEAVKSPPFLVNAIDGTKWRLWLYPRGVDDVNYIGFFLTREADSEGGEKVEIKFELSFLAKDDSVLRSHGVSKGDFPKGGVLGYNTFEKREDVYMTKRSDFLPRDTLTVRCRMWKGVGEMPEEVRCTAHTRIGVEKRAFLWNVRDFSTLELDKKFTYEIRSIGNDAPLMSVDLSLNDLFSDGNIIRFEVSPQDKTIKFASLQLFLVASGNNVQCNQEEFWFGDLVKSEQFAFVFTNNSLMAEREVCLPDDVLSLHWDWIFSRGVVLEEIDEVRLGPIHSRNKFPDAQKTIASPSHILNDSLKSLYNENYFCDITLKTNTREFQAHKVILGAVSPEFKAMFLSEKDIDCVSIPDLSDDTVRRMLLYIYTARVEDLTREIASDLYAAADKYAILSLKNVCSSYLKNNLSPCNACQILLLADFHDDGLLKSAVQNYILKHDKDVINSDVWKLLMEANGKLAAETVCLQYK